MSEKLELFEKIKCGELKGELAYNREWNRHPLEVRRAVYSRWSLYLKQSKFQLIDVHDLYSGLQNGAFFATHQLTNDSIWTAAPLSKRKVAYNMWEFDQKQINAGTAVRMSLFTGKHISTLCKRGFVANSTSHCAHFVSHALGITAGTNCWGGGNKHPGASIRVNEVFAACPQVGHWEDRSKNRAVLVFIINKANVDLKKKRMDAVRQKHIGVCTRNVVWHYANTLNKVVEQSPEALLKTFQSSYSARKNVALFYGTLPVKAKKVL